MQIAIIQTEEADFVIIHICVILKTFGDNCMFWPIQGYSKQFSNLNLLNIHLIYYKI